MKMRTLGPFVLALFVVAACGTEGGDDTTTVATDDPEVTTTADTGQEEPATTTTEAMDTTTSAAEAMDGVHATESDLGTILVDPDGFTVYVFTADTGGRARATTTVPRPGLRFPLVPPSAPISMPHCSARSLEPTTSSN